MAEKNEIHTKAVQGLAKLLSTSVADVLNSGGIVSEGEDYLYSLTSIKAVCKLAGTAEGAEVLDVLGDLCGAVDTFTKLCQSEERDAEWGQNVANLASDITGVGDSIVDLVDNLTEENNASCSALGLGSSLFGLVAALVATTDGLDEGEQEEIVKGLFDTGSEILKLIAPECAGSFGSVNEEIVFTDEGQREQLILVSLIVK